MKNLQQPFIPPTRPRDEPVSRCKRSCCWTPMGHSTAATNCTCHAPAPAAERIPTGALCPECRDGKPANCGGWTFDVKDQLVACAGSA